MSTFSFPIFSSLEIVTNLSETEIARVKKEDIENPSPDFLCSLYTSFLVYLDPLGDDPGHADFFGLEVMDNPDSHFDSIRIMNLCSKIKDLVSSTSCPTIFSLNDLIRPDPSRTALFISAIMNFCLYRGEKLSLLQPMAEKLSAYDQQHSELTIKRSEMNAAILEHEEAEVKEQPNIQALETEVKELNQTILNYNKQQMSLKSTFRTLKDKINEIDEKMSHAEFELVKNAQENSKLQSKIVQSPEKLQKALEDKKSMRDEARNHERSAMQCFQEKTDIVEMYTKVCKKMTKHLAEMQAIQEQVNSCKNVDKDVKVLKSKLGDEEMLKKSLEAKIVEQQAKVEQMEHSMKKLEKEKEFTLSEVSKELNMVKLETEKMLFDLEPRQKKVEAMLAEVDDINLKIRSIRESRTASEELGKKFVQIINEFHRYRNSVGPLLAKFEMDTLSEIDIESNQLVKSQ